MHALDHLTVSSNYKGERYLISVLERSNIWHLAFPFGTNILLLMLKRRNLYNSVLMPHLQKCWVGGQWAPANSKELDHNSFEIRAFFFPVTNQ
jgi:hypothetical protein